MGWQIWVALIYLAVSALLYVGKVGKQRPPITPAGAALGLIEYGAVAALFVWGAHAVR